MGYNEIGGNKLKIQGGIKMKTLFTKRDYFVVPMILSGLLAMTMLCWACDGDGTNQDADTCCDGVQPDGQSDSDADADTIGDDTPVQYGSLTVSSTPVQGAAIELDGDPTSQVTNYTFPNVEARTHSVLLSLAGRLPVPDGCTALPCPPASADVTMAGADVNIILYRDIPARWREETLGTEYDVVIKPSDPVACPTTPMAVGRFDAIGLLCIEADDTVSYCKTHDPACAGDWAEGQILEDGQRLEFTFYPRSGPPENYAYIRLP
jgi:hypothetical protein